MKKEKGISLQDNSSVIGKASTAGITLVALVVTIVVLLILAGITIVYVFGDNGVFGQASEAKLKTDIAGWQERLEMAKSPVFIEGLGTFDPDKYFDYIKEQGIINNKETDVINNGDGTYEVTTKLGYVFLVTLIPTPEKPTDAEIEYLGQVGKLPPRIKSIKVTGKTGTSIDIEVEVARLEDGKISYYYREVTEDNSKEYAPVKEDVTDLTATIGSLTDGKIYEIKVGVKNKNGESELVVREAIQQLVKTITLDKTTAALNPNTTLQLNATVLPENAENKTLEWSSSNEAVATVDNNGLVTTKVSGSAIITAKSTDGSEVQATCNITVKVPVTGITLNKTKAQVKPNATITLVATISPANATNKNVTWSSSNTSIATVSNTGFVTGKADGTVTITATSADDTTKSASCVVEVSKEDDWNLIAKIAKEIAEGRTTATVSRTSTQATVTVDGKQETITVGQEFYVKHNNIARKVRVLGFKHDTLTNPTAAYGSGTKATTAGISFEFAEVMIDTTKQMNSSFTNANGWAATAMRTYLEGSEGIGKISEACRSNIKQVDKPYIKTNNSASSVINSADKLWLLSCSEVGFSSSTSGAAYGYAIAKEGETYQYYQGSDKSKRKKGTDVYWWLRSPHWKYNYFCYVSDGGDCHTYAADSKQCVAPGFSI